MTGVQTCALPILGLVAEGSSLTQDGLFGVIYQGCLYVSCRKNFLDLIGGGGAFTKFVDGWIALTSGDLSKLGLGIGGDEDEVKQVVSDAASSFTNSKPDESIIFSLLTLCIPGIVYNLEKARQIDCYYVYCMEKMVPLGTPVYACQSSRALMYCEFVIGQLFAIIPFSQVIKEFGSMASEFFSDPLAAIGFLGGVACGVSWIAGFLGIGEACRYPLDAAQMVSIVKSIGSQFKSWSGPDYCKLALEDQEGG